MSVLLETRSVRKAFGDFVALDGVTMAVSDGEIVAVVGPNGAGKTTLVNLFTGLLEPTSGDVLFMGRNIAGIGPVELADHGLARAFQLIQIFPQLTVAETIAAAVVSRQKKRWRLLSTVAGDKAVMERAAEVADIFGLRGRLDTPSAALPQGEKKLLDVASAFALDPQVILLDEPTSGVSTADKHGIMDTLVAAAKRAGVKSIVLVEHDMDLVAAYSHRVVALAEGRVLADLPPAKFFTDAHLIETVIGKSIRTSSIAPRARISRSGGSVVRERSTSGGQRGSSRAGAPSHDVSSGLLSGAVVSTPIRAPSPTRVPAWRIAPLPTNVPSPISIGATWIHPPRARTHAQVARSAAKLALPKRTRRFRPTAVEISVRLPMPTPSRRSQDRV